MSIAFATSSLFQLCVRPRSQAFAEAFAIKKTKTAITSPILCPDALAIVRHFGSIGMSFQRRHHKKLIQSPPLYFLSILPYTFSDTHWPKPSNIPARIDCFCGFFSCYVHRPSCHLLHCLLEPRGVGVAVGKVDQECFSECRCVC